MRLKEKENLVERINARLKTAEIAILVDYKGLDVEKITKLRNELRQENVVMEVVKNTLLRKASQGTDAAILDDYFKGPNALITCENDPIAPAKITVKFAESNDKLELKAGVLNGNLLSIDEIKALAKMPSRDILLGQLLSVMNAVPTSMVRVLSGVPRSFLNVLNAIGEQKEAA